MPNDASYYDDAPEGGDASAGAEKQKGDDSKTALVPKSLFGRDLKPGDKCDIEVVAVHEQDYAVKGCEGHDEEKSDPQGGDESEPAAPPSEMSSMLED
jgi:hypothetical protein